MTDAVERLRETVSQHSDFIHIPVRVEDIAELLALHDEAVRVLKMALDVLRESDAADVWLDETAALRAFLAKAGGQ
jgi:hypothetical protein